ncbi:alkaline phosphatase family protein [Rhodocyclaceae bacterium SMB388]
MPGTALPPSMLPRDAVLPDYGNGGLLGLIRSIAGFLDGGAWAPWVAEETLPNAPSSSPVLVFMLIDGLGDAFLSRHGAGSRLLAHRRGRITSVFPSTTASAVTTTLTGLAPAAHGLTGWYIFDRRFGGVVAPLPLCARTGEALGGMFPTRRLFPYHTLFERRKRQSMLVSPAEIAHSPFSRRHGRGAGLIAYHDLAGFADAVVSAANWLERSGGGFVHAYYPEFDALSHDFGASSAQAIAEFRRVDDAFGQVVDRLAGTGADVVVCADHGFIDSPEEKFVRLDAWPDVLAMLAEPLWGERRAAFCEVRPGAQTEFERFVAEVLSASTVVVRSDALVEHDVFGPGERHPRLRERVGTHALLMQPGWTVWDPRPDEHQHCMLGVHGGLSADEMWVPLIHARC